MSFGIKCGSESELPSRTVVWNPTARIRSGKVSQVACYTPEVSEGPLHTRGHVNMRALDSHPEALPLT
jgi:hypothetical protein